MGVCKKTLESIEQGVVPERITCRVLFNIYTNFGIEPPDMVTNILKNSCENEKTPEREFLLLDVSKAYFLFFTKINITPQRSTTTIPSTLQTTGAAPEFAEAGSVTSVSDV